ncbi:MAG TPA: histidine kinase, partial [Lachnospiraceae bacterium]|nr:histidine kinase [Lachnospiraceae bacterium]
MGARNYIARELHDILGHSLVVTIKLLEVGKVFYKKNRQRACESLEKAEDAIKKGFEEMKEITGRDSGRTYHTEALEREIRSMLKAVDASGIQVSFFMRGLSMSIDEKVYDTLKRIATELVTNTLKHADAGKLLLLITVDRQRIVLQTMDNGRGVKNFVKGNGLNGIDSRLALVSGEAKYTAEENEGFSSTISIPL